MFDIVKILFMLRNVLIKEHGSYLSIHNYIIQSTITIVRIVQFSGYRI